MKTHQIEIIKLTTKEILLSFIDLATPFFGASPLYRRAINEYLEERDIDRANFLDKIQYLRRQGYIETFTENKEKFIELTPKGLSRLKNLSLVEIKIKRSSQWDRKWRVIIFDIPEKQRIARDIFRRKLLSMNFIQIQKSVYIYPFKCTKEITLLTKFLNIEKYVTIMISEIIQGENQIINQFLEEEILKESDIKKLR